MNIETLREICMKLPFVTEDVKWGNDLCFCIGAKMFCVAPLNNIFSITVKVTDDEFQELTHIDGIVPAPYVAKYKWILVTDIDKYSAKEWEQYIHQSYELVKAKLPKKLLQQLA